MNETQLPMQAQIDSTATRLEGNDERLIRRETARDIAAKARKIVGILEHGAVILSGICRSEGHSSRRPTDGRSLAAARAAYHEREGRRETSRLKLAAVKCSGLLGSVRS
jgi:hypothetical protein